MDDARAIARVHVRAWQVAYRGVVPDEVLDWLSVDERERRWRELLSGGGRWTTLVAGDDVAGFCTVVAPARDPDAGPRTGEIAAIYVSPERWRSGHGSALLAAALAELRRGGAREATLWVFATNAAAIAFYDRFGFSADGSERGDDFGQTAIRMRAPLGEKEVYLPEGAGPDRPGG